jgi:hypothetical protein
MKTMELLVPKEKIQNLIDKHEQILKSINEIEVSIKSLPTTISTLESSNDNATEQNETSNNTESESKKQKTGSYAACFNPPETPEVRKDLHTPSSYTGPVKGYFDDCQCKLDNALSTIDDSSNRDTTEFTQPGETVQTQQDEQSEKSSSNKSYAGAVKTPENDNTTKANEDQIGPLQKLNKSPTQSTDNKSTPSTPNTKEFSTEEVFTPGYISVVKRNRQPPKPFEATAATATNEKSSKSTQDEGWKLAPHRGSKSKK